MATLTWALIIIGLYVLATTYVIGFGQTIFNWVDERDEQVLKPLMEAVYAVHVAGAPIHGLNDVAGITAPQLVEVDVDPENLPEGENWVVQDDKVYVRRPAFVPSSQGMAQFAMLQEMEASRQSLLIELRRRYVALVEWERATPVPQWPHRVLWHKIRGIA